MELSYERLCGCGEDKDESWEDSFSFKQQEMHKKAFDSATTDPCYQGAPSHCSHRCMAHSGTVNVATECWSSPIKSWKDKSNSEEFTPACSGSFHVSRGPPTAPPPPPPGEAHYFGKDRCHFTSLWLYYSLFPFQLHTDDLFTM